MKTHLSPFKQNALLVALLMIFCFCCYQTTVSAQGFFGDPVENPFGITITSSEENLSFPVLVDIDNDGDMDLFISHRIFVSPCWQVSSFEFYENMGTGGTPTFEKHEGMPFGIPSNLAAFQFVDIDNDGDLDMFTFNHCWFPTVNLFENTGTPTAPDFIYKEMVDLTLYPYPFASLSFGDLDNDGDYDAMVNGIHPAEFTYLENIGTPEAYDFDVPQADPYGLEIPLEDGSEFSIFADWDCDGDLDIFNTHISISTGHDFTLYYYENIGTDESPDFTTPVLAGEDLMVGALGDMDGDGDMDMFADEYYFENISQIPACISSSVDIEPTSGYFNVYPNPASDYVSLQWLGQNTTQKINISVYDIYGKRVIIVGNEMLEIRKTIEIKTSELPQGIYLLKVDLEGYILSKSFNKL